MGKYVPNMLSIIRIILSVILLVYIPISVNFIIVYIVIGITDVLDGLIARKFSYESNLGAKLDSIADLVFYSIVACLFLKQFSSILEITHKIALIVIIVIRLVNMLFTKLKYKKIVFIHTLTNKASGFVIFLIPIVFFFIQSGVIVWSILAVTFLAAIEELLITVKYSKPDLNRKSIFFK
jgi:CDP-diacylglycerol--glycerol-3-phosphate 3-phosphatidyltransferase